MATVYPGPAPQPTIVTAQPNQMMQVQIEADKENYNFFGVSRGKHTFDVMASAYLAGGIPFVGVTVYKILVIDCQRNEDRFGEPFKQWEKNGLKVNYSGAHGGSKNVPFVPPVVRVQFPTE